MPEADINYWAVLVAGLSSMVVGAIWYGNMLFAKPWMRLVGKTEEDLKGGVAKAYTTMILLALVLAYILAHFVDYTGAETWMDGAVTAIWLWLGFVVTTKGADYVFSHKPLKLYLIDVGYHLVEMVVMGIILVVWM